MMKLTVLAGLLFLLSCKNNCEEYKTIDKCLEQVPTNELCQAYFQKWLYDEDKNSCVQIGYSGCSSKGFDTKTECEACLCNN